MSEKLYGRYEAAEEIGRGAMGIVYRARDSKLDRLVALKTLVIPHGAGARQSHELRRRFEREARTAGKLVHPNIVQIYDNGEDHIAMELVEGATLERLLQGPLLPLATVMDIMLQIAVALDYAHDSGVIHRDVKPANVLVARGGLVKVMDFGIARVVGAASTLTAQVVGTPRYMAPETVSGAAATAASDNFALAEVAYELLTGQMAFTGDSVANILYRLVHEDAVPPSRLNRSLPRGVDAVFARALAKNPANRYERAADFVAALGGALAAPPRDAEPTLAAERTAPRATVPPSLAVSAIRILVIPAAVVFAACLTLLLAMPEARLLAREWLQGATRELPPAASPSAGIGADAAPAALRAEAPAPVPSLAPPPAASPAPAPAVASTASTASEPASHRAVDPAISLLAPPPPAVGAFDHEVAWNPQASAVDGMYGMRFFGRPYPGISGVQVRSVEPGSAAWEGGIRAKDIITAWRGAPVATVADLAPELATSRGRPEVRYLHEDGGSYQARSATLGSGGGDGARLGVAISGVQLEHGVRAGKERGVEVRCVVEVRGYAGRSLKLLVEVDEITGEGAAVAVLDGSSRLRVSEDIRPAGEVRAQPATLFLPYERLARGSGEHAMRLNLSVVDESERPLATYAPLPFLVSSGG